MSSESCGIGVTQWQTPLNLARELIFVELRKLEFIIQGRNVHEFGHPPLKGALYAHGHTTVHKEQVGRIDSHVEGANKSGTAEGESLSSLINKRWQAYFCL